MRLSLDTSSHPESRTTRVLRASSVAVLGTSLLASLSGACTSTPDPSKPFAGTCSLPQTTSPAYFVYSAPITADQKCEAGDKDCADEVTESLARGDKIVATSRAHGPAYDEVQRYKSAWGSVAVGFDVCGLAHASSKLKGDPGRRATAESCLLYPGPLDKAPSAEAHQVRVTAAEDTRERLRAALRRQLHCTDDCWGPGKDLQLHGYLEGPTGPTGDTMDEDEAWRAAVAHERLSGQPMAAADWYKDTWWKHTKLQVDELRKLGFASVEIDNLYKATGPSEKGDDKEGDHVKFVRYYYAQVGLEGPRLLLKNWSVEDWQQLESAVCANSELRRVIYDYAIAEEYDGDKRFRQAPIAARLGITLLFSHNTHAYAAQGSGGRTSKLAASSATSSTASAGPTVPTGSLSPSESAGPVAAPAPAP